MCLYPKLIKNKKYEKTKKNGGNPPPITDERIKYVPIACQKCIECRKMKSREWQIRLLEHIKTNTNGKFITLTFSDESIKKISEMKPTKTWKGLSHLSGYYLDNEIATHAVRLFTERWRKTYSQTIHHWLITELGHQGTENIHLHGIIWTNESMDEIERHWQYGTIWKGKMYKGKLQNYVNEKTVNYIIKYITKVDQIHSEYKPKVLTSKGIGNNYTNTFNSIKNKFNEDKTDETYKTRSGHKISMPIYWRNALYTEEEREKLWIYKLNKETRYVLGQKIDVSKTDKHYLGALQHAREINKELNYGTDIKNYEEIDYQHKRRELMRQTRIQKALDKEYKEYNKNNIKKPKSKP